MRKIPKRIEILIEKYLNQTIDKEGLCELHSWYYSFDDEWVEVESEYEEEAFSNHLKDRLEATLNKNDYSRKFQWLKYGKVAAAILAILSFSILGYYYSPVSNNDLFVATAESPMDVFSPDQGALLILSDQQVVDLSDQKQVEKLATSSVKVNYNHEGGLVFGDSVLKGSSGVGKMNRLVVPKAKLFQMVLGDGTKVWLNADSKLDFPNTFLASERRVSLVGEAYFEVAKDKNRPFIVQTDRQNIKVLGTEFNVSSYPESEFERTSLFGGSVEITNLLTSKKSMLKPGEDAVVTDKGIAVDVMVGTNLLDWRLGEFVFERESLSAVLQKVGRWYDVDVSGVKDIPGKMLSGKIRTQASLSEVLQIINLASGLQFELKGKEVVLENNR